MSTPQSNAQTVIQTPAVQISEAVLERMQQHPIHQESFALEVELKPPELGSVRISMQGEREQVDVRLIVREAAAYHLIEHNVALMRQRLEDAGMTVARFDVDWNGNATSDNRQPQHQYANERPNQDTPDGETVQQLNRPLTSTARIDVVV